MSSYMSIDYNSEYGSISGYSVAAQEEQLRNWLNSFGVELEYLKKNYDFIADAVQCNNNIAILKNLFVDEDHRNKGIGTDLVEDFLSDASDSVLVFLISDSAEIQDSGFDLETWYNSFGFEKLEDTGMGPLLVLNQSNCYSE